MHSPKRRISMTKQPSVPISGKPSILIEGGPAVTTGDFVAENNSDTSADIHLHLMASGEPTVLLDGQPAATVSSHTTADSGHPTQSVVSGKPTVLVNGQPAVGLNDPLESLENLSSD